MDDRFDNAPDETLLQQTSRTSKAFGVFYDRYETQLLGFFVRATGRPDLAADLTAEVFAKALASLSRFDPELGTARAWLFGIARHELAGTWERGQVEDRARRRIGMEPVVMTDEALERINELGQERAAVALAELPDDQRHAVTGRIVEERDYAELARSLQCSESVVRKRVSRGLLNLRNLLKENRT